MNTGTPASAASWAPTSVGRPTVVSPSDSSTIAPGATSSSSSSGASSSSSRSSASRVSRSAPVARASPMAVDSASSNSSIPRSSDSRSSVGGTSTVTTPLNEIRPTSMSGATCSTNDARRLLGRLDAVGLDVGGHHRQRDVEQHEDAALALGALGRRGDRPGDGDHAGGQARQLQQGDDVSPPAGAGRRDPVEQLDLREADGRPAPPPLDDDVGDAEPGDGEQPPQPLRVEELDGDHLIPGAAPPNPISGLLAGAREAGMSSLRSLMAS